MKKRIFLLSLFILCCLQLVFSVSYADDAEVLPKGITRVGINNEYYFPVDERYNPDGDVENIAVDYNTNLNGSVFPALGLLEAALELPSGFATIGNSVVDFELQYDLLTSALDYGLTDRLTVGIRIPYWWAKNTVKARLDSSSATVGKSAALATLLPLGVGDTVPLTTEDVQDLLGDGLDVNGDGAIDIAGFGYDRVETWSDNGIGDIQVGARYQYLKTEDWRLAFTGGVRFPTGTIDDADNLQDWAGFTPGAYALLFHFQNDYTGINNLVLNGTFRYDLVLPDKETKRVPNDVNLFVTTNKEEVSRDLGDQFAFEASGKYELLKGFSVSLLYRYMFKLKDDISGNRGFAYESLEAETDFTSHVYITGFTYSTLSLFQEKKFPYPLTASITFRNRFAGSNNASESEFLGFNLQAFF